MAAQFVAFLTSKLGRCSQSPLVEKLASWYTLSSHRLNQAVCVYVQLHYLHECFNIPHINITCVHRCCGRQWMANDERDITISPQ
jgi:hypothetical protein